MIAGSLARHGARLTRQAAGSSSSPSRTVASSPSRTVGLVASRSGRSSSPSGSVASSSANGTSAARTRPARDGRRGRAPLGGHRRAPACGATGRARRSRRPRRLRRPNGIARRAARRMTPLEQLGGADGAGGAPASRPAGRLAGAAVRGRRTAVVAAALEPTARLVLARQRRLGPMGGADPRAGIGEERRHRQRHEDAPLDPRRGRLRAVRRAALLVEDPPDDQHAGPQRRRP